MEFYQTDRSCSYIVLALPTDLDGHKEGAFYVKQKIFWQCQPLLKIRISWMHRWIVIRFWSNMLEKNIIYNKLFYVLENFEKAFRKCKVYIPEFTFFVKLSELLEKFLGCQKLLPCSQGRIPCLKLRVWHCLLNSSFEYTCETFSCSCTVENMNHF